MVANLSGAEKRAQALSEGVPILRETGSLGSHSLKGQKRVLRPCPWGPSLRDRRKENPGSVLGCSQSEGKKERDLRPSETTPYPYTTSLAFGGLCQGNWEPPSATLPRPLAVGTGPSRLGFQTLLSSSWEEGGHLMECEIVESHFWGLG